MSQTDVCISRLQTSPFALLIDWKECGRQRDPQVRPCYFLCLKVCLKFSWGQQSCQTSGLSLLSPGSPLPLSLALISFHVSKLRVMFSNLRMTASLAPRYAIIELSALARWVKSSLYALWQACSKWENRLTQRQTFGMGRCWHEVLSLWLLQLELHENRRVLSVISGINKMCYVLLFMCYSSKLLRGFKSLVDRSSGCSRCVPSGIYLR